MVGLRRCRSATRHRGAPVNARAGSQVNRTSGRATTAGRGDAERCRCPGAVALLRRSFTSPGRTDAPEVGLLHTAADAAIEAWAGRANGLLVWNRSRTRWAFGGPRAFCQQCLPRRDNGDKRKRRDGRRRGIACCEQSSPAIGLRAFLRANAPTDRDDRVPFAVRLMIRGIRRPRRAVAPR